MQAVALDIDGQGLLQKGRATNRRHAPRATQLIGGLMQTQHGLAVMAQMEGHVETGQGQALDHFLQVIEFGFLGLEKLASRRRIEKQVAHLHRSAHRMRRRLHPRLHVAAFGFHLPGLLGAFRTRGQGQTRHRADGGQGLATKAQAHHLFQVFQLADLAGGMAGQGQGQVVSGDTTAIVAHLEQLDTALLNFHFDTTGARVQAVFQQLLDHRSRPLDHFSGGNLVGQPRAEQLDATGLIHGWAARAVAGICSFWPTLITSPFRVLALRKAARLI